jgi:D-tyrosyl-tRNA(Tyr) deacylase
MRAVIQRVSEARCKVSGEVIGEINKGFLVLLGIEHEDSLDDVHWLAQKIVNMRIFNDDKGLMNKSLLDVNGKILIISQFTLMANTKKGNRPSFIKASKPDQAILLYEEMISKMTELMGTKVETGSFGADMQLELINDGPVTIMMNTKDKENY